MLGRKPYDLWKRGQERETPSNYKLKELLSFGAYKVFALCCFRKNRLKKEEKELIQKLRVEIEEIHKTVNELCTTEGVSEVRLKCLVRH